MSKLKFYVLNNTQGFVCFSRIQIVGLVSIMILAKSLILPAIICALIYSFASHYFEVIAWNGGRSEFGARWKWIGRAWVFDGYYCEELGFGVPREPDKIIFSHFRPFQKNRSLI